jgi:predicted metal-dependent phosphoesterase TrpH
MQAMCRINDKNFGHIKVQYNLMKPLLRVEFHCHTIYSKDSLQRVEDLLATCRRKGIDRVVVTDHNTIEGARRAIELAPEMVIVGEEIRTTEGEFLAAYVAEEVPPGLPPMEALGRLRAQGAFISVAHPFDSMRSGDWQPETLQKILPKIDALEVFNARCMLPRFNKEAEAFARRYGVAGTVGSDAHTGWEVGRAIMELPAFGSAVELRVALEKVKFHTRLSPPWIHFSSRYAVWRKSLTSK